MEFIGFFLKRLHQKKEREVGKGRRERKGTEVFRRKYLAKIIWLENDRSVTKTSGLLSLRTLLFILYYSTFPLFCRSF